MAYITDSDTDSDIDTGKSTSLNTSDEERLGRKKEKKRYFGDSTDEDYVPGKKKTKKNKKGQAAKKKTPQTKKSNSGEKCACPRDKCPNTVDDPLTPETHPAVIESSKNVQAEGEENLSIEKQEKAFTEQEEVHAAAEVERELTCHDSTNPSASAAAAASATAILSNASCARFLESVEAVQEVTSTVPVTQEEFIVYDEKMTFDFPHF